MKYTTKNGNKKSSIRYIINPELDSKYTNKLLKEAEVTDITDIAKSYFSNNNFNIKFSNNHKNSNSKNIVSNVKILDTVKICSFNF